MRRMNRTTSSAALLLAVSFCAANLLALSPAASISTNRGQLPTLVLAAPKGFTSNTTDGFGLRTGLIDFNGAMSSDCNVSDNLRGQWVASELRSYSRPKTSPTTHVLVCLTLMKSRAGAKRSVTLAASNFGSVRKPLTSIPGAMQAPSISVAATQDSITFTRGDFFVMISIVDRGGGRDAQALGISFAVDQYQNLRTY